MSKPPSGRLLSIAMISLGLTACGSGGGYSGSVAPAQTPPTTLTGNWLLAGSRVPATYPDVSTSIYILGNQVFGQTVFSAQCTSGGFTSTSGATGFPMTGTIANDGTFQASTGTIVGAAGNTFSLSLTGKSPLAATPSVWTGTYSIVFTPGSAGVGCSITQSATFAATPIAPVTGTYIGVPALSGTTAFGPGAIVSVQITQGTPTLVTKNGISSYPIPLTANLTISNSSCPLSSTTGSTPTSSVGGDTFELAFPLPVPAGGGFLDATLDDPTSNTFSAHLDTLANANGCPGLASYNFTRK